MTVIVLFMSVNDLGFMKSFQGGHGCGGSERQKYPLFIREKSRDFLPVRHNDKGSFRLEP